MSQPPVRLAIVGVGAVAQTAHLPILAKMKGVTVVALCDNDGAKARALAERFGVPDTFTDIEDLLDLDEVDAVVVASPNHLHEPHVLAALKRGVHVLCGRPLALNTRGVERILAAAQKADRKVLIDNHHRFRADVQALDRYLRGGELGRVSAIRTGHYRLPRPRDGWRYRLKEAGGGAFLELGYPLLDLALWLCDFPEPTRVTAHMERGRGANAVEDAMVVQLECANGLSLVVDVNWSYVAEQERFWFETVAAKGSARLAPLRVVKDLNGRPTDVSPKGAAARESPFIQSYRAELAHFLSVVAGESKYEAPDDQVTVHRVLEAVYRSADEGKEVRL